MNLEELYTKELHSTGSKMQLKDENGELLDMFITLQGVDSKEFRAAKVKLQRDVLEDIKGDSDKKRADALASVTKSWEGFKSKGKLLKFSKEKAAQLYFNAPYVMDQADTFINQRVNFTKG